MTGLYSPADIQRGVGIATQQPLNLGISEHKPIGTDPAFQPLKEHRGGYFVEYLPARTGHYFATLNLIFLDSQSPYNIADIMEQECTNWIQRYPVPLMVTSFDDAGNVIHLEKARACDHLIGTVGDGKPMHYWKLLSNEEFPLGPLREPQLRGIYSRIPYSSAEERRAKALAQARAVRAGILLIAMWGIIVPAAVSIIGLASPILGVAIVIYGIGRAVYKSLKMLGYIAKDERERQKDVEELKMRHHHYHCERNPHGFLRLKTENFDRELRENIRREAEEIRQGQKIEQGDVK
jgi:hypothetical protein